MSAKRLFNESQCNQDQPAEKRGRPRRISFASAIEQVIMANSSQNLFSGMEPWLRRVVKEEVDNALRRYSRCFTQSPSLEDQALETSSLQLIFSKKLSLPVFTASKIGDINKNPLQVLLVDRRFPLQQSTASKIDDQMVPIVLPYPIKIKIVVLDGDFPPGDRETWTSEEFNKNIVKERAGKKPLLTGDQLCVTMREGLAPVGDIEFTDNSSWIRSRKFRLGAKVVSGSSKGVRICEAITEAFVVKDHRGESYKKHYPPMLEDEVWRLEKIAKDGSFHKKLQSEGINTVQDFLKLSVVDTPKLKGILGPGMSDKMWEVTIKHARTCILGDKLYSFQGNNCVIILNPICNVVGVVIDGELFPTTDPAALQITRDLPVHKNYIENLVRAAYANWNSLQEVDATLQVIYHP